MGLALLLNRLSSYHAVMIVFPKVLTICTALALMAGCEMPKPDRNAEVFRTREEIAAARIARQHRQWRDMAASLVRAERPGVEVTAGERLKLTVAANGVTGTIDLEKLSPGLEAQSEQAERMLRPAVMRELALFDQQRLAAMSFAQAKEQLRPMLLGEQELADRSAAMGASLHSKPVAADLFWLPAVRWSEGGELSPVGPDARAKWNVPMEEVEQAALANLNPQLGTESWETVRFGPAGRLGQLKPETEPAVILLPRFVQLVREAWQTDDNLALLAASPRTIQFVEERNTALIDRLHPQWQHQVEDTPRPLSSKVLVIGDSGISVMKYNPPIKLRPTTLPVKAPGGNTEEPKKKPVPYIAR